MGMYSSEVEQLTFNQLALGSNPNTSMFAVRGGLQKAAPANTAGTGNAGNFLFELHLLAGSGLSVSAKAAAQIAASAPSARTRAPIGAPRAIRLQMSP